jgi:hypothetical protein
MLGGLYHCLPKAILDEVPLDAHSCVFIEASFCMQDQVYTNFFLDTQAHKMMDCGTGFSPDLNHPTEHLVMDRHFDIKYLKLFLQLEPEYLVIPDILNCGPKTYSNFIDYSTVLYQLEAKRVNKVKRIFVIQGETHEEALLQVSLGIRIPNVTIAFPRIVRYYYKEGENYDLTGNDLTTRRIEFIEQVLPSIKEKQVHIHIFGMNSITELIYAARNNITIDTRLASLAAVNGIDISATRPPNLKIDLLGKITDEQKYRCLQNIKTLNEMYYGHTK